MLKGSRTVIAVLFAILVGTGNVVHAGADADQSGNNGKGNSNGNGNGSRQLVVLSASVNRASETLILRGQNFGSVTPAVYCETTPMTVISTTDSQLVVLFPASVPDGTYLFTVICGSSEQDRAVFFVTTVAPSVSTSPSTPGPAGPPRPPGPPRPEGANG